MRSRKATEETIRTKLNFIVDPPQRDQLLARATREQEQSWKTEPAPNEPVIRRMIMKSSMTKLATAAAILVAVMLGMYIVTGSFDGASITIAQVRQALQDVDWVRVTNKIGKESAWYSFGSKIQALVDGEGRIIFFDFNAGKKLIWNPGSEVIYESPIQKTRQFAGGISGITEGVNRMFDSLEKDGWNLTKELGTYEGKKVEVWVARGPREGRPGNSCAMTMYIDVETKLPVGVVDVMEGPDGATRVRSEAGIEYPATGPADIYEAGAPRSAQIKPAPQQEGPGEQVTPQDSPR
jgi:hypothetical protein